MTVLNCCMGIVVEPSTVVDQDWRGPREHIVRVQVSNRQVVGDLALMEVANPRHHDDRAVPLAKFREAAPAESARREISNFRSARPIGDVRSSCQKRVRSYSSSQIP